MSTVLSASGLRAPFRYAARPAAASGGDPPPEPEDSRSDGAGPAPPPDMARLGLLVVGSGAPTALGDFFGPEADRVHSVERSAGNEKAPGGWKIGVDYPPSIARQRVERILADDAPVGWSSAWAQAYRPPLGCWVRREGAWESCFGRARTDPTSPVDDALLALRLEDDGPASMVLWERLGDGGGIFYRLDAQAWLQHPDQAPPLLEMYPYAPGEPTRAPFYQPPSRGEAPPAWEQFFGPNAPEVRIGPRQYPGGGAEVQLTFRWGWMRNVYLPLLKDSKPGFVHESYRMEDQVFQRWERTEQGWIGETEARALPENFADCRRVVLRTVLDEDGRLVEMVLRAEGRLGERTEYVLDGSEYLAGRATAPRVREVNRCQAPPAPSPRVEPAPEIHQDDEWVIIGDVKLKKRAGSPSANFPPALAGPERAPAS
ncbi:MAG: hypothetical protein HY319_00385 [Armatimonadetes bacterium]|nr:hypothetical protein [Armatimonadota bacterium]